MLCLFNKSLPSSSQALKDKVLVCMQASLELASEKHLEVNPGDLEMYKNNDKSISIKVSLNQPIRMALKEFHPEALFKLALKPGDLIVRKICPSVRKICTSDFVSIFRVGSINENYIAIYPASRSTFEDACLNGLVSKIKLGDVTKLFWI